MKKAIKSATNPESGMFVKGDHKKQFAYEAHTDCDRNGYIFETGITFRNVHDSAAFNDVYDKITERFSKIEQGRLQRIQEQSCCMRKLSHS